MCFYDSFTHLLHRFILQFPDNTFYLTHPYGSHLSWHDDIRIE
jgi:hypothetical protein